MLSGATGLPSSVRTPRHAPVHTAAATVRGQQRRQHRPVADVQRQNGEYRQMQARRSQHEGQRNPFVPPQRRAQPVDEQRAGRVAGGYREVPRRATPLPPVALLCESYPHQNHPQFRAALRRSPHLVDLRAHRDVLSRGHPAGRNRLLEMLVARARYSGRDPARGRSPGTIPSPDPLPARSFPRARNRWCNEDFRWSASAPARSAASRSSAMWAPARDVMSWTKCVGASTSDMSTIADHPVRPEIRERLALHRRRERPRHVAARAARQHGGAHRSPARASFPLLYRAFRNQPNHSPPLPSNLIIVVNLGETMHLETNPALRIALRLALGSGPRGGSVQGRRHRRRQRHHRRRRSEDALHVQSSG